MAAAPFAVIVYVPGLSVAATVTLSAAWQFASAIAAGGCEKVGPAMENRTAVPGLKPLARNVADCPAWRVEGNCGPGGAHETAGPTGGEPDIGGWGGATLDGGGAALVGGAGGVVVFVGGETIVKVLVRSFCPVPTRPVILTYTRQLPLMAPDDASLV